MREALLFICLLLLSGLSVAADAIPSAAQNCAIETPPDNSGEDAVHAMLIKVFPRKSSVAHDYTGCQTAWFQKGDSWAKVSVMYFEQGKLRTWWSAEDNTQASGLVCRFTNGKLDAKQPKECYVPAASGLQATFAPGCLAHLMKSQEMDKACLASMER